ncbi:hypothetical protein [Sulfitobacter sabulilitoris]|uniref:hypothetical protein n=1 Tax=Sulfitobacter sabulilitoris TaxID=2562655 RepID=UPI0014790C5B|nr:hypothetical protein [Sulfitobacter sabulilitoris]
MTLVNYMLSGILGAVAALYLYLDRVSLSFEMIDAPGWTSEAHQCAAHDKKTSV